eukprot:g1007.t1
MHLDESIAQCWNDSNCIGFTFIPNSNGGLYQKFSFHSSLSGLAIVDRCLTRAVNQTSYLKIKKIDHPFHYPRKVKTTEIPPFTVSPALLGQNLQICLKEENKEMGEKQISNMIYVTDTSPYKILSIQPTSTDISNSAQKFDVIGGVGSSYGNISHCEFILNTECDPNKSPVHDISSGSFTQLFTETGNYILCCREVLASKTSIQLNVSSLKVTSKTDDNIFSSIFPTTIEAGVKSSITFYGDAKENTRAIFAYSCANAGNTSSYHSFQNLHWLKQCEALSIPLSTVAGSFSSLSDYTRPNPVSSCQTLFCNGNDNITFTSQDSKTYEQCMECFDRFCMYSEKKISDNDKERWSLSAINGEISPTCGIVHLRPDGRHKCNAKKTKTQCEFNTLSDAKEICGNWNECFGIHYSSFRRSNFGEKWKDANQITVNSPNPAVNRIVAFELCLANVDCVGVVCSGEGSAIDIKTINSISKANPAVVTITGGHGYATNDMIFFSNFIGMPELNRGKGYIITRINTNTFSLNNIDSSNYETFTSGKVSKMDTTCKIAVKTNATPDNLTLVTPAPTPQQRVYTRICKQDGESCTSASPGKWFGITYDLHGDGGFTANTASNTLYQNCFQPSSTAPTNSSPKTYLKKNIDTYRLSFCRNGSIRNQCHANDTLQSGINQKNRFEIYKSAIGSNALKLCVQENGKSGWTEQVGITLQVTNTAPTIVISASPSILIVDAPTTVTLTTRANEIQASDASGYKIYSYGLLQSTKIILDTNAMGYDVSTPKTLSECKTYCNASHLCIGLSRLVNQNDSATGVCTYYGATSSLDASNSTHKSWIKTARVMIISQFANCLSVTNATTIVNSNSFQYSATHATLSKHAKLCYRAAFFTDAVEQRSISFHVKITSENVVKFIDARIFNSALADACTSNQSSCNANLRSIETGSNRKIQLIGSTVPEAKYDLDENDYAFFVPSGNCSTSTAVKPRCCNSQFVNIFQNQNKLKIEWIGSAKSMHLSSLTSTSLVLPLFAHCTTLSQVNYVNPPQDLLINCAPSKTNNYYIGRVLKLTKPGTGPAPTPAPTMVYTQISGYVSASRTIQFARFCTDSSGKCETAPTSNIPTSLDISDWKFQMIHSIYITQSFTEIGPHELCYRRASCGIGCTDQVKQRRGQTDVSINVVELTSNKKIISTNIDTENGSLLRRTSNEVILNQIILHQKGTIGDKIKFVEESRCVDLCLYRQKQFGVVPSLNEALCKVPIDDGSIPCEYSNFGIEGLETCSQLYFTNCSDQLHYGQPKLQMTFMTGTNFSSVNLATDHYAYYKTDNSGIYSQIACEGTYHLARSDGTDITKRAACKFLNGSDDICSSTLNAIVWKRQKGTKLYHKNGVSAPSAWTNKTLAECKTLCENMPLCIGFNRSTSNLTATKISNNQQENCSAILKSSEIRFDTNFTTFMKDLEATGSLQELTLGNSVANTSLNGLQTVSLSFPSCPTSGEFHDNFPGHQCSTKMRVCYKNASSLSFVLQQNPILTIGQTGNLIISNLSPKRIHSNVQYTFTIQSKRCMTMIGEIQNLTTANACCGETNLSDSQYCISTYPTWIESTQQCKINATTFSLNYKSERQCHENRRQWYPSLVNDDLLWLTDRSSCLGSLCVHEDGQHNLCSFVHLNSKFKCETHETSSGVRPCQYLPLISFPVNGKPSLNILQKTFYKIANSNFTTAIFKVPNFSPYRLCMKGKDKTDEVEQRNVTVIASSTSPTVIRGFSMNSNNQASSSCSGKLTNLSVTRGYSKKFYLCTHCPSEYSNRLGECITTGTARTGQFNLALLDLSGKWLTKNTGQLTDSNASTIDDVYNGKQIYFNEGIGTGRVVTINDYNGTTKQVTWLEDLHFDLSTMFVGACGSGGNVSASSIQIVGTNFELEFASDLFNGSHVNEKRFQLCFEHPDSILSDKAHSFVPQTDIIIQATETPSSIITNISPKHVHASNLVSTTFTLTSTINVDTLILDKGIFAKDCRSVHLNTWNPCYLLFTSNPPNHSVNRERCQTLPYGGCTYTETPNPACKWTMKSIVKVNANATIQVRFNSPGWYELCYQKMGEFDYIAQKTIPKIRVTTTSPTAIVQIVPNNITTRKITNVELLLDTAKTKTDIESLKVIDKSKGKLQESCDTNWSHERTGIIVKDYIKYSSYAIVKMKIGFVQDNIISLDNWFAEGDYVYTIENVTVGLITSIDSTTNEIIFGNGINPNFDGSTNGKILKGTILYRFNRTYLQLVPSLSVKANAAKFSTNTITLTSSPVSSEVFYPGERVYINSKFIGKIETISSNGSNEMAIIFQSSKCIQLPHYCFDIENATDSICKQHGCLFQSSSSSCIPLQNTTCHLVVKPTLINCKRIDDCLFIQGGIQTDLAAGMVVQRRVMPQDYIGYTVKSHTVENQQLYLFNLKLQNDATVSLSEKKSLVVNQFLYRRNGDMIGKIVNIIYDIVSQPTAVIIDCSNINHNKSLVIGEKIFIHNSSFSSTHINVTARMYNTVEDTIQINLNDYNLLFQNYEIKDTIVRYDGSSVGVLTEIYLQLTFQDKVSLSKGSIIIEKINEIEIGRGKVNQYVRASQIVEIKYISGRFQGTGNFFLENSKLDLKVPTQILSFIVVKKSNSAASIEVNEILFKRRISHYSTTLNETTKTLILSLRIEFIGFYYLCMRLNDTYESVNQTNVPKIEVSQSETNIITSIVPSSINFDVLSSIQLIGLFNPMKGDRFMFVPKHQKCKTIQCYQIKNGEIIDETKSYKTKNECEVLGSGRIWDSQAVSPLSNFEKNPTMKFKLPIAGNYILCFSRNNTVDAQVQKGIELKVLAMPKPDLLQGTWNNKTKLLKLKLAPLDTPYDTSIRQGIEVTVIVSKKNDLMTPLFIDKSKILSSVSSQYGTNNIIKLIPVQNIQSLSPITGSFINSKMDFGPVPLSETPNDINISFTSSINITATQIISVRLPTFTGGPGSCIDDICYPGSNDVMTHCLANSHDCVYDKIKNLCTSVITRKVLCMNRNFCITLEIKTKEMCDEKSYKWIDGSLVCTIPSLISKSSCEMNSNYKWNNSQWMPSRNLEIVSTENLFDGYWDPLQQIATFSVKEEYCQGNNTVTKEFLCTSPNIWFPESKVMKMKEIKIKILKINGVEAPTKLNENDAKLTITASTKFGYGNLIPEVSIQNTASIVSRFNSWSLEFAPNWSNMPSAITLNFEALSVITDSSVIQLKVFGFTGPKTKDLQLESSDVDSHLFESRKPELINTLVRTVDNFSRSQIEVKVQTTDVQSRFVVNDKVYLSNGDVLGMIEEFHIILTMSKPFEEVLHVGTEMKSKTNSFIICEVLKRVEVGEKIIRCKMKSIFGFHKNDSFDKFTDRVISKIEQMIIFQSPGALEFGSRGLYLYAKQNIANLLINGDNQIVKNRINIISDHTNANPMDTFKVNDVAYNEMGHVIGELSEITSQYLQFTNEISDLVVLKHGKQIYSRGARSIWNKEKQLIHLQLKPNKKIERNQKIKLTIKEENGIILPFTLEANSSNIELAVIQVLPNLKSKVIVNSNKGAGSLIGSNLNAIGIIPKIVDLTNLENPKLLIEPNIAGSQLNHLRFRFTPTRALKSCNSLFLTLVGFSYEGSLVVEDIKETSLQASRLAAIAASGICTPYVDMKTQPTCIAIGGIWKPESNIDIIAVAAFHAAQREAKKKFASDNEAIELGKMGYILEGGKMEDVLGNCQCEQTTEPSSTATLSPKLMYYSKMECENANCKWNSSGKYIPEQCAGNNSKCQEIRRLTLRFTTSFTFIKGKILVQYNASNEIIASGVIETTMSQSQYVQIFQTPSNNNTGSFLSIAKGGGLIQQATRNQIGAIINREVVSHTGPASVARSVGNGICQSKTKSVTNFDECFLLRLTKHSCEEIGCEWIDTSIGSSLAMQEECEAVHGNCIYSSERNIAIHAYERAVEDYCLRLDKRCSTNADVSLNARKYSIDNIYITHGGFPLLNRCQLELDKTLTNLRPLSVQCSFSIGKSCKPDPNYPAIADQCRMVDLTRGDPMSDCLYVGGSSYPRCIYDAGTKIAEESKMSDGYCRNVRAVWSEVEQQVIIVVKKNSELKAFVNVEFKILSGMNENYTMKSPEGKILDSSTSNLYVQVKQKALSQSKVIASTMQVMNTGTIGKFNDVILLNWNDTENSTINSPKTIYITFTSSVTLEKNMVIEIYLPNFTKNEDIDLSIKDNVWGIAFESKSFNDGILLLDVTLPIPEKTTVKITINGLQLSSKFMLENDKSFTLRISRNKKIKKGMYIELLLPTFQKVSGSNNDIFEVFNGKEKLENSFRQTWNEKTSTIRFNYIDSQPLQLNDAEFSFIIGSFQLPGYAPKNSSRWKISLSNNDDAIIIKRVSIQFSELIPLQFINTELSYSTNDEIIIYWEVSENFLQILQDLKLEKNEIKITLLLPNFSVDMNSNVDVETVKLLENNRWKRVNNNFITISTNGNGSMVFLAFEATTAKGVKVSISGIDIPGHLSSETNALKIEANHEQTTLIAMTSIDKVAKIDKFFKSAKLQLGNERFGEETEITLQFQPSADLVIGETLIINLKYFYCADKDITLRINMKNTVTTNPTVSSNKPLLTIRPTFAQIDQFVTIIVEGAFEKSDFYIFAEDCSRAPATIPLEKEIRIKFSRAGKYYLCIRKQKSQYFFGDPQKFITVTETNPTLINSAMFIVSERKTAEKRFTRSHRNIWEQKFNVELKGKIEVSGYRGRFAKDCDNDDITNNVEWLELPTFEESFTSKFLFPKFEGEITKYSFCLRGPDQRDSVSQYGVQLKIDASTRTDLYGIWNQDTEMLQLIVWNTISHTEATNVSIESKFTNPNYVPKNFYEIAIHGTDGTLIGEFFQMESPLIEGGFLSQPKAVLSPSYYPNAKTNLFLSFQSSAAIKKYDTFVLDVPNFTFEGNSSNLNFIHLISSNTSNTVEMAHWKVEQENNKLLFSLMECFPYFSQCNNGDIRKSHAVGGSYIFDSKEWHETFFIENVHIPQSSNDIFLSHQRNGSQVISKTKLNTTKICHYFSQSEIIFSSNESFEKVNATVILSATLDIDIGNMIQIELSNFTSLQNKKLNITINQSINAFQNVTLEFDQELELPKELGHPQVALFGKENSKIPLIPLERIQSLPRLMHKVENIKIALVGNLIPLKPVQFELEMTVYQMVKELIINLPGFFLTTLNSDEKNRKRKLNMLCTAIPKSMNCKAKWDEAESQLSLNDITETGIIKLSIKGLSLPGRIELKNQAFSVQVGNYKVPIKLPNVPIYFANVQFEMKSSYGYKNSMQSSTTDVVIHFSPSAQLKRNTEVILKMPEFVLENELMIFTSLSKAKKNYRNNATWTKLDQTLYISMTEEIQGDENVEISIMNSFLLPPENITKTSFSVKDENGKLMVNKTFEKQGNTQKLHRYPFQKETNPGIRIGQGIIFHAHLNAYQLITNPIDIFNFLLLYVGIAFLLDTLIRFIFFIIADKRQNERVHTFVREEFGVGKDDDDGDQPEEIEFPEVSSDESYDDEEETF